MTSIVVVLVMTMLCVGFGRASYIDLPLTMAVLSFGGGLIFARFMERHL
jgi:multicomponent Na+:H+ antiporter subunit F